MIIELGKKYNHHALFIQGGWVTDTISDLIENALKADCWNFNYIGGRQSSLCKLGNEIEVVFGINDRREDCQEFVDYLNMIIRPHIPTAFTVIQVSPYDLPEYGDKGGLTILCEIAQETGCEMDPGEWMKPVVFHPHDNLQYNAVIELLLEFKMSFFNWDYKAGKRESY